MNLRDFKLERYFGKHEFTAKHLLSSSDCDGFSMNYILEQATAEELAIWENLHLGYTESAGHPLLLEAISKHYNTNISKRIVVATPGELNYITMNVLLKKEDHAVVVAPSYQSLYEVIKAIGCTISYWKPNEKDWTFNVADLRQLITPKTKVIVINFPHNPTGSYLSKLELEEIITIARENNCYLFSDEMYHKLMVSNAEELPTVCDLYEKGISLWGTSKSFGLAGLRTGWIVAQDEKLIEKIIAFKDYLSICNSAPAEILTIIALNHSNAFLKPNIEKIKKNSILFKEFQEKHKSIFPDFVPPKVGSTSFVPINYKGSALEFSDQLVEKTGIMAVPSEMFEYLGKYLRIGFGRENFKDTLNVLDTYLIKQQAI
ncbi:aminotransferase class I/II-fold pyridoxal phosphate-dependent enzyme [Pontimicrobium sp. SW4]|uniref:Aminotransferase class I/II-fold pyridoxal phosphate-dependent enzyme n=1 Tax=Pontimicrobium sp. SW4 TaxID=3153519 RepID=A0AAU7BTR1_9FLAO